jgi:type IV pilus assembly protein PilB
MFGDKKSHQKKHHKKPVKNDLKKRKMYRQLGEEVSKGISTEEKIKQVKVAQKAVTERRINALINGASKDHVQDIIVDLFNDLMVYASAGQGASDLHIEPWEEYAVIRIRIDGILYDKFKVNKKIYQHLIALLKILTKMRTDEHRAPQDGRFEFMAAGEGVDVRASLIPTSNGEKAVLRFLSSKSHKLTLEQLGFLKHDLEKVSKAIHKNWGMILATGPTGSGKTTSIYAILEEINKREVNITTIEDPVEFEIDGVNQSQVDRSAKLDFATGLRSLLRQDPDIIMVGEIRDHETAKIAVNAAMTGHKLLSTVHTNNAATTVLRLIDMGVEPYLVSSTLICAIAQRLVRRLCPLCKKKKTLTLSDAKKILKGTHSSAKILMHGKISIKIAVARGCDKCNGTGYKGRIGIYEIMENTPEIQELILAHASSNTIQKAAIKNGMTTMTEDGLKKVRIHETTLEEYVRVMQE